MTFLFRPLTYPRVNCCPTINVDQIGSAVMTFFRFKEAGKPNIYKFVSFVFCKLVLSLTSILLTVYSSSNLYNDPGYRIKKFISPTCFIGDHHFTSNVQYYFLKIGYIIFVFLNP